MGQSSHFETSRDRPKASWRSKAQQNEARASRPLFTSAELHALKTGNALYYV